MRRNPILSGDKIAGLVVGEGCFYVESQPDPKYRLGWRIRPAFCIEMRSDDREVLECVRDALACGHVYELDFGRYRGYEKRGWAPHAKFRVSKLGELHDNVVPFFDRHELFGRKRIAYELFRDIVIRLHGRTHASPEGLKAAKALAEALRRHNARGTGRGLGAK